MQPEEIKRQIDEQLSHIDQLPAMPDVVARVVRLASDPDADIHKLSEEISHDTAITAGVIRLSNSAYYRPQRPIRSIQEAVVTLGLRVVKNIILVTASKGILAVPLEGYRLEARDVWDHSLLVAELAGRICRLKRAKVPPDVAYTAGILHDIGKIILSQYFKRIYRMVALELEKNPTEPFESVERRMTGYDHASLGGRLLAIWKFPADLCEAVSCQYHPETARTSADLACVVHVANQIALASGVGVDTGGLTEPLSKFALDRLQLTDADLASLYSTLPELLQEMGDLRAF